MTAVSRHGAMLAILLTTAACSRTITNPAPPRVDTAPTWPSQTSTIVVPITSDLDALAKGLDAQIPTVLYKIDEHKEDCVPAQRVDLGIAKVKVVPKLGCRIVGQVTRGKLSLSGSGNRLDIRFPARATISARDVGGIVKKEVATGAADIHAVATLSIVGNWQPRAVVDIRYDWTTPPGIDLLGQRIEFTRKADERLKPIIAKLERELPRELAKLHLRRQLDGLWRQAFTAIQLNRRNPPVWMRVTPQRVGVGGYRIVDRRLELTVAAAAMTQTFVGDRPAYPTPTPLPAPSGGIGPRGLRVVIPVLADYAQLEPVVARALRKLAAKGITLTGIGPVDATFGKVTVYATTDAHLAVGVETTVKARGVAATTTRGTIWLTALPYNDPGSQIVSARDIGIAGRTDSPVANMLVALFDDTDVIDGIRTGLTHDFGADYARIMAKAKAAIGERREGDFLVSATIDSVRNGRITVTGRGLYMPVEATGTATIAYRPR